MARAERERRDLDRVDLAAPGELADRRRQARVVGLVRDRLRPARDEPEQVDRHRLARAGPVAPVATLARVEPAALVAHPELGALLVVVEQPDVADLALAFVDERLREHAEE